MEIKTDLLAILIKWDELRGFGFLSSRNPDGTRRCWFLHHTGIKNIEDGGVPEVGAEVYFHESDRQFLGNCLSGAKNPKKRSRSIEIISNSLKTNTVMTDDVVVARR